MNAKVAGAQGFDSAAAAKADALNVHMSDDTVVILRKTSPDGITKFAWCHAAHADWLISMDRTIHEVKI